MSDNIDTTAQLRALLEGLECEKIDVLMTKDPEVLRAVGVEIARAARLGAPLYAQLLKALPTPRTGPTFNEMWIKAVCEARKDDY